MRQQDIVPEYERSNPMLLKLMDSHRALSDNKAVLLEAFEALDPKKTGVLKKRDFVDGLKAVDKSCRLNIPRILFDDMCQEAATMFAPEKDLVDPQDIVYYKDFVYALEKPPTNLHQTMEHAFESSQPAARMARTTRFIERPRQGNDFSILERMKAHVIQNDLRTLLALRRGLDPGSGTRETFLRLDADRDGVIGKEDLRQNLMELGMVLNDDSMELILSYCDVTKKGGIDFMSFVKSFEANGRGWFNPFNPHKRLPEPPYRHIADKTSPAYARTPSEKRVCNEFQQSVFFSHMSTASLQRSPRVSMDARQRGA